MTESSEQSASLETSPAAADAAAEAAPVNSAVMHSAREDGTEPTEKGALSTFWTLFVRLLMLGFGVSLGWILGVLVAQVLPAKNPHPPLAEVVMRRTSQTWRKARQLPQWWRSDGTVTPGADIPISGAASPPEPEVIPRLTLAPELQQQVQEDLALLQADLATLESRLAELEASLGEETTAAAVETRLYQLDQLLNPPDSAETPAALPPPPLSAAAGGDPAGADEAADVYGESPFSLVTDSIVLPSSLVFEPGGSRLTASGQQLLNTIVPDLQRYPSATLLVGSHTASDNAPQVDRQLTFQQAMAVQRYLEQQLGDAAGHWVTLGYGQTRPRVAGSSPEAQQRNQRIEIGIVP